MGLVELYTYSRRFRLNSTQSTCAIFLTDIIAGGAKADPSMLAFRDPHHLLVGNFTNSMKPGSLRSPRKESMIQQKKF